MYVQNRIARSCLRSMCIVSFRTYVYPIPVLPFPCFRAVLCVGQKRRVVGFGHVTVQGLQLQKEAGLWRDPDPVGNPDSNVTGQHAGQACHHGVLQLLSLWLSRYSAMLPMSSRLQVLFPVYPFLCDYPRGGPPTIALTPQMAGKPMGVSFFPHNPCPSHSVGLPCLSPGPATFRNLVRTPDSPTAASQVQSQLSNHNVDGTLGTELSPRTVAGLTQ